MGSKIIFRGGTSSESIAFPKDYLLKIIFYGTGLKNQILWLPAFIFLSRDSFNDCLISESGPLKVKFAAPRLNPEGNRSRYDFVILKLGRKREVNPKAQERERSIPIEVDSIKELRSRLDFRYTSYADKRPLVEIFVDGFLLDVCIMTNLKEETKKRFERAVILEEV